MKRDQIKFLAALTALLLLAGCSGESTGSAGRAGSGDVSPENTHVHAAAERWERDAKEHWHLCGCGEKMDIGEHTLDDMFFCAVCGSEVQDYGDTVDVYTYNEQGDPLQTTSYDADGAVLSDQSWEYEYDENGGKKTERSYNNGVLAEVTEYVPGADGESRTVKYTSYNEDGSYFVNEYDEMELYRIIRDYGEDKFAKNIAKHIVRAREEKRIETTGELIEIIKAAIPAKVRAVGGHPAKRTFQAIRIELNHELDVLNNSIDTMIELLNPEGRLSIITFHSLEDRIVKNRFKENENPCICPSHFPVCVCGRKSKGKVITRKPIIPSEEEIEMNKRSKSSKLRVFERCE